VTDDARAREEFLAGERPDEVALYVADEHADPSLRSRGLETGGGVLLVLPGERGRSAFEAGTGVQAMTFAGQAMGRDGRVADTLDDGECPEAGDGEDHAVRFLLAFAEEQNEAVGGQYADGDVVHAYAQCTCGVAYSDRWVVGER
jgi:hypothetical protein